ncbi:MAG: hypothetical protein PUD93_02935 [Lachnospiraceae bacterium]|nr:hypothetical protein [Lachnospiraceae bacterium]
MVNGIFSSFQSSYGVQQIPRTVQEPLPLQKQEADQGTAALGLEKESVQEQSSLHTAKPVDLENVSLTFHKEESFDYIGNDSSLDNLDMQKAVSDMKKDMVLQEYQYFVGRSGNLFEKQTEDGLVIQKDSTGMV